MSHSRGGPHGMVMLADKKRTRPTKHLLGIFWSYLREFKKTLVLITFIILLYTLAATFQPILIQQALDLVIDDPGSDKIAGIVAIFFVLSLVVWVFQSLNTWIMAEISTELINDIRSATFESLVNADMAYHHKNQSGNVTSRVVSDTQEIANGLQVFTTATIQILLIIATLVVLTAINPLFTGIALLAVPVAIVISKIFGTIGKKRMLAARQSYGHVSGKLAENLAGVAIAKSFNQEERVSAEIKELNYKTYGYMKKLIIVFILVFPTISMVSTILVYSILLVGGFLSSNSTSMTIGVIFLGTVMVQRFLMPVMHLANYYTQLQASLAALDRITDILEAEPAVTDDPNAKLLDIPEGTIKFDNVSFEYEMDTRVVENVNFNVQAGSKVALVGHTGAGKTTITSLLMRYYDPIEGSISIDNQDLKSITIESLYANISLVSQEPYLFAGTVIENIRYGKPEAIDDDIYDLCSLLGADQFIEALPQGYQTVLQESGKSLSAGQRQMITIARTMLSNPKILILDEATSRLDAYSESLVQNAQKMLFEGRTTLIIAHRLSTIRDVDQIIVMEHGKIKEMGLHEDLMANKNTYFELYNTYYAHQGLQEIQIEVTTYGSSSTSSVEIENEINVIQIIQERIEFFKEQSDGKSNIRFDCSGFKDVIIAGNSIHFKKIIDGIIQRLNRMRDNHQISSPIEISLVDEHKNYKITVGNKDITIPEKMHKMVLGMNAQSRGMHPHRDENKKTPKPLNELVEDMNGGFELQSPIAGNDKGTKFITSFAKLNL